VCVHVIGFYKYAWDNSSCLACHFNSTTISRGAFLLSQCMCIGGYFSTDLLSSNVSCSECGLGHYCHGNQHRSPCDKVSRFDSFSSVFENFMSCLSPLVIKGTHLRRLRMESLPRMLENSFMCVRVVVFWLYHRDVTWIRPLKLHVWTVHHYHFRT
jgi:hypothetical protein